MVLGTIKNKDLIAALNKFQDDDDITLEFLMASFYPKAYENMHSLLEEAHMMGYRQAMEERE